MQTIAALILSMTKRSADTPWSIKFELGTSGLVMETTVGVPAGAASAGPYLHTFITDAEAKLTQYPYHYDVRIHAAEMRAIDVRFLAEKPVLVDMRQKGSIYLLENLAPANFVGTEESVSFEEGGNAFTQMQQENARIAAALAEEAANAKQEVTILEASSEEVTAEFPSGANRYWIFFNSQQTTVVDGDTIHGYIVGYVWPEGEMVPEKIGNQNMLNDSETVSVRYLGADTFETYGDENRNAGAAKRYGNIPWEVLNRAALEAKEYNRTMIQSGKILAISLQYNTVYKSPSIDDSAGKRLLGVVYATNYSTFEEARAAIRGNYFKGINVNKELLRPMYSDYQAILEDYPQSIAVPLAEFTGVSSSQESDGLKIVGWMEEMGLRNPPTLISEKAAYGATKKEIDATTDVNAAVNAYESNLKNKSETRIDETLKGYINNDQSFVKPYDDRVVEQKAYRADRLADNKFPWDYVNRVRVGDVFIPIPPLSIRMDKQYSTEKVSVMRSKSSLQKSVGNVRNILTMDLYYHDLETINGTEMTGYVKKNRVSVTYAMDGLRPLIAQFKKAPFLPIDNEYINETLGIHNVALRNMQIQTVPGFPSALKVTLMVEEFDTKPFLMGEGKLAEKINYPLLRWHYQQLLHEPFEAEPWRSYLPKVEQLDNRVTFSILDEEELMLRQEIVRQFRSLKTPNEYKEELLDGESWDAESTEKEYEYNDGLRIKAAIEQMERFVKYVADEKPKDASGKAYKKYATIPVVIGEAFGWDAFENLFKEDVSSTTYGSMWPYETALGQKIAKAIYGTDPADKGIHSVKMPLFSDANVIAKITTTPANAFYPLRSISSGSAYSGTLLITKAHEAAMHESIVDNNYPGFFQLYLTSAKAKEKLKGLEHPGFKRDDEESTLFLVPATLSTGKKIAKEDDYLQILKELLSGEEDYNKEVEKYTAKYNALAREINRTEADMKMNIQPLPNLIPLDLQVALENTFSTVQVQTAETPTMQYFGSQDPQIRMSFETDQSGVQAMEDMLRQVGGFVKQYRDGLVTGFMSIDNQLLNMLGVRHVLPLSAQYNTIAGHPDRFAIDLVLAAFDKTQRRQEALYGYTGGNPDEKLLDRAYQNYDPAKDGMYVHERMRQMELYPDLGMAKIEELNEALPSLNAQMDKWENRANQVFLDPDFYVSTNETFRKYLKDALDDTNGVITRFQDASGMQANSDLNKNNPLDMEGFTTATGESMLERFNSEAEELTPIEPKLTWPDFGKETASADESEAVTAETPQVVTPAKYVFGSMNDFMKNKEYADGPDYETWQEWGRGGTEDWFKTWKKSKSKEPAEDKVWHYLADCILTAFNSDGNLYLPDHEYELLTDDGYDYNGNVSEEYTSDTKLGSRTWANGGTFYTKEEQALRANKTRLAQIDTLYLENGRKPSAKADNSWEWDLPGGADENMPFQRIFSYLRALIRAESNWRQFENGEPLFVEKNADGYPVKTGITGALMTKARKTSDMNRLIWDWKYNIKFSVDEMAKVYKKAMASPYGEIRLRALDWAIVSHSGAEMPAILESGKKKDDVADGFLKGPITPERSAYYLSIDKAKEAENQVAKKDRATGLYLGRSSVLESIYKLYNRGKSLSSGSGGGQLVDYTEEEIAENIVEENKNLVFNLEKWTTEEKFKGMFTDMYQHDQNGRLLRAFPSFSMQLIDEGKWFNNYRTWDNFYGFSALHSIDVYKSRKIAADTAVIKMSNMYSGLTTKRKDMEYSDLNVNSFFSSQFWEQDILNIPDEEILADRKEMFKSMMLQTGARVHLRMGYGSDARYLPVVFNGTVTEVGTGDEVEIVCQGDGIELSNVISGSEDDTNKGWFTIYEPSEYIGRLLTSKGNWIKDFINYKSEGEFFKEGPLGIVHFGSAIQAPTGVLAPWNHEFGESAQNVYSQNGQFMKEQWRNKNNHTVEGIYQMFGGLIDGDFLNPDSLTPPEDEDNILVNLYGSTPWDIIQTFALCSSDYVAAVVPFETRSTLFFGKPHWPMTYKYDNEYNYDKGTGKWNRTVRSEHQKTFMQAHIYTSSNNLISNDIKASEEGVYTNVLVSYDGHMAGPMQADNDIRLDKQKTTLVEANIMGHFGTDGSWADIFGPNYYTAEAQAQVYGMSAVRDYMKDMYKGSYTVMGDPTLKPYDVCFMTDMVQDMEGIHLVKAVHHSMSMETGFISIIEPDAYVVNWDAELLFLSDKIHSVGKNVALRAGISAAALWTFSKMSSHIMSVLSSEAAALIAKFGDKVGSALLHRNSGLLYELLGKMLGDEQLITLARSLKDTKVPEEVLATIHTQLKLRKEALKADQKTYKALAKYKKGNQSLKYKEIVDDVLKQSDNIDDALDQYRDAVKLGKTVKATNLLIDGNRMLKPFLARAASMAGTVLKSSAFWLMIVDLLFEVATSGLLEMWTRSKQNAECVKIVPLTYKGQSYTAGITGHRGSVWGDTPSLAQRWKNGEWGSTDTEITDSVWSWLPIMMNALDSDDPNMNTSGLYKENYE